MKKRIVVLITIANILITCATFGIVLAADLGPWSYTTSLNQARHGLGAATYNGYLYAVGGNKGSPPYYLNSVEAAIINADGTLGSWSYVASLNQARTEIGVAAYNGYLYAVGGDAGGGVNLASVEVAPINADGSLDPWFTTSSLNIARTLPGVATFNGYIYSVGGGSGSSLSVSSVEFSQTIINQLNCVGFEPPMDKPVAVQKKNRVLPLKMVCYDENGEVTDLYAPPVVEVDFNGTESWIPTEETALPAGQGDEGNQFVYSGNYWQFNLQTKNFNASGMYTIKAVSGDESTYVIVPYPEGTFEVE